MNAGLIAAGILVVGGIVTVGLGLRDEGPRRLTTGAMTDDTELAPSDTGTLPDDDTDDSTATTSPEGSPTTTAGTTATTATTATTTTTTTAVTVPAVTAPMATAPPTTVATTTTLALGSVCFSPTYGWDVSYPSAWYTADPSTDTWACSLFDPAPIVIEEDSEVVAAITINFYEMTATDAYFELTVGAGELLSETGTTVERYAATRLETRASGDGYWPAGTLIIDYIIDRGGWSTVVIEGVAFDDVTYRDTATVVDAMAATISFWDE